MAAKTYYPKPGEIAQEWLLIDAEGQILGRLATRIAEYLLGKGKPQYTPGVDAGDHVVVINATKTGVTGRKLDQKVYFRHSAYPGGMKVVPLREQLARHPERVIQSAVWGMLPHNRYGRKLMRKLKVYAGPDHPQLAQYPRLVGK